MTGKKNPEVSGCFFFIDVISACTRCFCFGKQRRQFGNYLEKLGIRPKNEEDKSAEV